MKRVLTVLFAIGFIIALLAGASATAYLLGGLADAYLFRGAHRLVNILILMLAFVMLMATALTIAERKWSAFTQNRMGPNRARIALPGLKNRPLGGMPHIIADSVASYYRVQERHTQTEALPRARG